MDNSPLNQILGWMEDFRIDLRVALATNVISGDRVLEMAIAKIKKIQEQAQLEQEGVKITGETSDGYHTFNELYEFRKLYNACLFNEWHLHRKFSVHKSIKHFDGELCFGGGWFIVMAMLPTGQISNHYEMKDWDLFNIPEAPEALFQFDGHTPKDVLDRLSKI